MARTSASNAVVSSVENAAAIYGVRCYRMQSRTVQVKGAGGRERPMFMGAWKDALGVPHYKGMADVLLTPKIKVLTRSIRNGLLTEESFVYAVALWVECKSGTGELRKEQVEFRNDVLAAGAFYIEAHDSADAVIEWFKQMGVAR